MKIYVQNSLLLHKNHFVVVIRSLDLKTTTKSVRRFALYCLVASAYGGIEGNIAHLKTRSCSRTECGKNALRNVVKTPSMFRKCPKTLQECSIVAIMP